MYGYKRPVRNIFQRVLYGMETGKATFHKALMAGKTRLDAILPPLLDMGLREYGKDVEVRYSGNESFHGQAQYWSASQFKELLGHGGAHPVSHTSCGDYEILFSFHGHDSLREYKNFFVILKVNRK